MENKITKHEIMVQNAISKYIRDIPVETPLNHVNREMCILALFIRILYKEFAKEGINTQEVMIDNIQKFFKNYAYKIGEKYNL